MADASILRSTGRYHKWLVFISCYVSNMIYVGYVYSQGSLFVIVMQRYNSSRLETSTIQFLASCTVFGNGIFAGVLVHKVGERITCMISSMLGCVAFALSAFATSVPQLVFSLGLFVGLSITPMYIGCSTATGRHFEGSPYSSLVLSILATGGSAGGALYPYLIQYLNDRYGMPGICLVLAGIFLQGSALAQLWSPPKKNTNLSKASSNTDWKTVDKVADSEKETATDGHTHNEKEIRFEFINMDKYETKAYSVNTKEDSRAKENLAFEHDSDSSNVPNTKLDKAIAMTNDAKDTANLDKEHISSKLHVNIEEPATQICKTKPSVLESLKYLLKLKMFWTFVLGIAVIQSGMNQLPIFIVDIFTDKMYSESSAVLSLLLYNVFSGVGRALLGIVMRLPRLSPLTTLIIDPVIGVVGLFGVWFSPTVETALFSISVFGVAHGIITAAFLVTTTKLAGVEHMSNAMGLLFTVCSIGVAITGPLSGHIRDVTNSYKIPIWISVGACGVALVLFITTHVLYKKHLKNKTQGTV